MHHSTHWHKVVLLALLLAMPLGAGAQHSIARQWNEALLEAIRNDLARPTVHARNLFHTSAAMYDAWATLQQQGQPYLLGQERHGFTWAFDGFEPNEATATALDKALSHACYRLLHHRFAHSVGAGETLPMLDSLMLALGYDATDSSVAYTTGSAAALGNYIAQGYIAYGAQDGANEEEDYANRHYTPVNTPLDMSPYTNNIPAPLADPNRWQPLEFDRFVDQSGNEFPGQVPDFLSAEWGAVLPFALAEDDRTLYERNGEAYWVYHDPGPPPYLSSSGQAEYEAQYTWGFELVLSWSAHMSPADSVYWDISPGSIGNLSSYPQAWEDYASFYNFENGGDNGRGHPLNPHTGEPYAQQLVPRGDYARVLAEFWADGPDSETPPGHWYTIFNTVSDHPALSKQIEGQGPVVSDLEWDIKGYFALGGAMHDAAIAAWGIKGWYDYIRPVSAIRWMGGVNGQRTDATLPNYHEDGLALRAGRVGLVTAEDRAQGMFDALLNEVKVYGWQGPLAITNPEFDDAEVGWLLARKWWPYQRPTFVTPPFAGYVSGHSTFSRAAAEVLTAYTGDAYFPGGMGEFEAPKNNFLVFEKGPSQDVTLQWATYRDASDQCSLSRIWGGIHPPADDIPGRLIGIPVGQEAWAKAAALYNEGTTVGLPNTASALQVYPNPTQGRSITIGLPQTTHSLQLSLYQPNGRLVLNQQVTPQGTQVQLSLAKLPKGLYLLRATTSTYTWHQTLVVE